MGASPTVATTNHDCTPDKRLSRIAAKVFLLPLRAA